MSFTRFFEYLPIKSRVAFVRIKYIRMNKEAGFDNNVDTTVT